MNEGVAIITEVDEERIKRRLQTKYVDTVVKDLDEALRLAREALKKGEALSIALVGNAADVACEFVRRGITPDVLTDQTSAHDDTKRLCGYGRKIPRSILNELMNRWPCKWKRCWNCRNEGQ